VRQPTISAEKWIERKQRLESGRDHRPLVDDRREKEKHRQREDQQALDVAEEHVAGGHRQRDPVDDRGLQHEQQRDAP
jgi:hypothetical protein